MVLYARRSILAQGCLLYLKHGVPAVRCHPVGKEARSVSLAAAAVSLQLEPMALGFPYARILTKLRFKLAFPRIDPSYK